MKIVAVIPVKKTSERVGKKNTRNFYKNSSLLDILIKSLLYSYKKAISIFKKKDFKHDGLISVEKFKRFVVTENKLPLNYAWGVWHPYSQNLDNLYSITFALFMMSIKQFKVNRYVISKNPYYLESSNFEGIDIDTMHEFKLAQLMYKNKNKLKRI